MDIHTATEQAYKRGYSAGYKAGRRTVLICDEPVEGKWIPKFKFIKFINYCSVCGHTVIGQTMKHCPNCGKKMR